MTLRVLFDATMIKAEQGGIRSYARGLARAVVGRADVEVVVVAPPWEREWFGAKVFPAGIRAADPARRTAWRARHVPSIAQRIGADLIFVPSHETVPRCAVPQVFVVHDVGPLVAPALYGRTRFVRYATTLGSAVRRADAAVCVSTATKLDVLRTVDGVADRLHVIGQGAQQLPPEIAGGKDQSPADMVLYVGAALKHKNLRTLVDAFRTPVPGMPSELVMVGPEYGSEVAELRDYARGIPNVRHLGFVSASELGALYSRARCLAFPSLHEGFGIPLLEAMREGLPIVASDIPSLREVALDAACWVHDPSSAEEWRHALSRVGASAELRTDLVRAGRIRLEHYSWSGVADQMVGLWSRVVGSE
jgi:glycosyltransferase involved in cell wall biosynthesis